MLKEELGNSLRIRKDCERAMARLPKGALVRKIIRGCPYYYLAVRDGKHVRFVYKDKMPQEEIRKYQEAMEYRRRYRKQISEINRQVRYLKRILRGKESV
ncbi:MAG: hypothetical protein JXB04_07705 [Kiritimatiellae bacterium]|nr:hypothetical protein [Kiritimatiellia bacterium]